MRRGLNARLALIEKRRGSPEEEHVIVDRRTVEGKNVLLWTT